MKSFNALWRTYLFIVVLSLGIAFAIAAMIWRDVKHEAGTELKYANNLVSSSVQLMLNNYEALLKILGERLIELDPGKNPQQSRNIINNLLADHPELAGFGLATVNGQLILTSQNINRSKLPNLLTKPETARTFKLALQSDSLVMGRTYRMKALGEWVIPLRYRITNSRGDVLGVMITGLKLNSTHSIWTHGNLPNDVRMIIINSDFYRQVVTNIDPSEYADWYNKPVSQKEIDSFSHDLISQSHINISDLRHSNKAYTVTTRGKNDQPFLTSVSYKPQYHFYIFTALPFNVLVQRMYAPIGWLLLLIFVVNATIYMLFRTNIRLQNNSEKELEFQAKHDELTSMPNRRFLFDEFDKWYSKHPDGFNVLFIDLDNFKASNDLYGHSIGDKILREVSARINRFFNGCLRVRQGGDEFIILTDKTDDEIQLQHCYDFIEALKQPIIIDELEFSIRASLGIARAPDDGKNLDTLLRKADMAMYEAKRQNVRAYIYSDHLEKQNENKAKIEKALNTALQENEFSLVYQPQFDTQHKIIGVEALLRWHSASLGNVPPNEFIPIAESTGMIDAIGDYVFEKSLDECKSILPGLSLNNITHPFRLSINVSVHQLVSNNFLDNLLIHTQQHKSQDIQLMLEVTESLFIEEIDKARRLLSEVQKMGIEVSLDDFGTGYSSLSLLSKLPINELKIDKSFVRDILSDTQDWHLIQSIISIGKSLGIPVLAEGIESAEQAHMLYQAGCDSFQGYYYAKPMPIEQFLQFINDWRGQPAPQNISS